MFSRAQVATKFGLLLVILLATSVIAESQSRSKPKLPRSGDIATERIDLNGRRSRLLQSNIAGAEKRRYLLKGGADLKVNFYLKASDHVGVTIYKPKRTADPSRQTAEQVRILVEDVTEWSSELEEDGDYVLEVARRKNANNRSAHYLLHLQARFNDERNE